MRPSLMKMILACLLGIAASQALAAEPDLAATANWKSAAWIDSVHDQIQSTEKLMGSLVHAPSTWGIFSVLKGNQRNLIAARVDIDFLANKLAQEGLTAKDEHDLQTIVWNVGFDASAAKNKMKIAASRRTSLTPGDMKQLETLNDKLLVLVELGKVADKELEK